MQPVYVDCNLEFISGEEEQTDTIVVNITSKIDEPQIIIVPQFGEAVGLVRGIVLEGFEYQQVSYSKGLPCSEYSNGEIPWANQNIAEFDWHESPYNTLPDKIASALSDGQYEAAVLEIANDIVYCTDDGGSYLASHAMLRFADGKKYILRGVNMEMWDDGIINMQL